MKQAGSYSGFLSGRVIFFQFWEGLQKETLKNVFMIFLYAFLLCFNESDKHLGGRGQTPSPRLIGLGHKQYYYKKSGKLKISLVLFAYFYQRLAVCTIIDKVKDHRPFPFLTIPNYSSQLSNQFEFCTIKI